MIKQKFGVCENCSYNRPVNSKSLCPDCMYLKNHGETRFETRVKKQREKKIIYKPIKRKQIKFKKKESTGELEMFCEIWEERPHYCSNTNCGRFLGNEMNIQFFSHRKSKGAYPELRLCKDNIDLLCSDCHHIYEFGDRSKIKI